MTDQIKQITGLEVAEKARELVERGCKFRRQATGPDYADCLGLGIWVGLQLNQLPKYNVIRTDGQVPDQVLLKRGLDEWLIRKDITNKSVGDIVLMRLEKAQVHVGILADGAEPFSIIQTLYATKKAVEHRLDEGWRNRIVRVYRFPGVVDGW